MQNLTTIGPVRSEIICPIKIKRSYRRTDGQIDRQMETGDLFLRIPGVMKDREKVKVESRSADSITILSSLALGR